MLVAEGAEAAQTQHPKRHAAARAVDVAHVMHRFAEGDIEPALVIVIRLARASGIAQVQHLQRRATVSQLANGHWFDRGATHIQGS